MKCIKMEKLKKAWDKSPILVILRTLVTIGVFYLAPWVYLIIVVAVSMFCISIVMGAVVLPFQIVVQGLSSEPDWKEVSSTAFMVFGPFIYPFIVAYRFICGEKEILD